MYSIQRFVLHVMSFCTCNILQLTRPYQQKLVKLPKASSLTNPLLAAAAVAAPRQDRK